MPEVANTYGAVPDALPPAPTVPDPTLGETFASAARVGSDVVNAYNFLAQRHTWPADPSFNLRKRLEDDQLFDMHNQDFVGVTSPQAYDSRKAQILQESRDQDVLARSGKTGVAASLGMGLISPTMFLPFVGEARGLKGIAQTAKNALIAGLVSEVPIMANQPGKPLSEISLDIGAQTVLGAILGGAHVMLRPGEQEALVRSFNQGEHMAVRPGGTPIPAGASTPIAESAGGIAPGGGLLQRAMDSNQVTRNPVTFNLAGESDQMRWMTAQTADSGLSLEGNKFGIPTTPGGTVENRVPLYYALYGKTAEKLDELYRNYYYKGEDAGAFGGLKARAGGNFSIFRAEGQLSRPQFNAEVTRAGWSGDLHPDPHVQEAAQFMRQTVFDPILKRLQEAGLLGDQVNVLADKSYVHRLFDHGAIIRDTNGFVQMLANKFEQKLNAEFSAGVEKLSAKAAKDTQTTADLKLTAEDVAKAKQEHLAKLEALNQARTPELTSIEDQLSVQRASLYELRQRHKDAPDIATKLSLEKDIAFQKDGIKALEGVGGQGLTDVRQARKAIADRVSNLNRAQGVLASKQRRKLEMASKIEENSIESLRTIARAGQRILNKLDTMSDVELNKAYAQLQDQFAKLARVYDRGEEQIGKIKGALADQGDFVGPLSREDIVKGLTDEQRLAAKEAGQEVRGGKLSDLTDQIAEHETLDRDQMRQHIGDQLEAVIARTQELNSRRALREAKLREEAKALDPQKAIDRIAEIHARRAQRESDFLANIRERGGNDVGLDKSGPAYKGTADFGKFAEQGAREVKDKILGTTLRSPTVDMMQGDRAAVLARVLDISSHDLEPWLDTDIERIVRTYLRTSGPDIELAKKFGDVQAEKYLGNGGTLVEEMNNKIAAIETQLDKKGRPLSEAAKAKESQRITEHYTLLRKNFEAIVKRLRHQDGLPTDPNALGYRLGKAALNINTLRFMGGVTLSSLPDAARVIMRYGAIRTFRDGFVPLVKNFAAFKMGAQEIKYAGAANEIVSNARGRLLNDIFDDMHRGSKFEQGLEWAASKQGIVGAFAYWTDAMKMFTGVVGNAKILDSIAETMTGKSSAKTAEFLAQNGIGPGEAAQIWDQVVRNGGGQRVNGVWMPNTEAWDNPAAQDAFRAAVNREVNNAIVTPGVERPLWMTGSMTGRLLGQFKSFTFSSTTRMLQAGLQQRDMAVAEGMALSLAFGALSYYLYAVAAGGSTEDEMRNAGPGKWADEAIARSGIEGALGLGQDLLSRIPATQGISSFSGGRTLRHGGGSLVEALAGPTFDAVETGARVVSELNSPDSGTVHAARKLVPWQNVTGIRRIFDAIEAAAPVPEKN